MHVAVLFLSTVVAVTIAVPIALNVTLPEDVTVATLVLEEDHIIDLLTAFDGNTVAINWYDLPGIDVYLVVFSLTRWFSLIHTEFHVLYATREIIN